MEVRHGEREKEPQIVLCLHGLLPDVRILRQVDLLILHKPWRGRERSHQAEQAVPMGKAQYGLLQLRVRRLVEQQQPDIDGLYDECIGLRNGVIHGRLRISSGQQIVMPVRRCSPFVVAVLRPVRMGVLKQVCRHGPPASFASMCMPSEMPAPDASTLRFPLTTP